MRLLLALLAALVVVPSALGAAPKPGPNMPVDGGGDIPPSNVYANPGFVDSGYGWDISPDNARYGQMGAAEAVDYSDVNFCCVPDGWYARERCHYNRSGYQIGIWPYHRAVYLDTNWCWIGSAITYRRTNLFATVDYLCSREGSPHVWKMWGGGAQTNVAVHGDQQFGCQIIPVGGWAAVLHDTVWTEVVYYAGGYFAFLNGGG
jgi:hypothetical protein